MLVPAPRFPIILVGGAMAIAGTSSAEPKQLWESPYEYVYSLTSSDRGYGLPKTESEEWGSSELTARAIAELRRFSGLTWDQLSLLFGVSRRSVHFWASGKALNAANEERLYRVLDVVRSADRGDATTNRHALLTATDGTSPFDLLVQERFDEARALLDEGEARPVVARRELSPAAKAARMPLPPEELMGTLPDEPIHRDVGRSRAGQSPRSKRNSGGSR